MAAFGDSALLDLQRAVKELQRITCEDSRPVSDHVGAAVHLCTEVDLILRHGLENKSDSRFVGYW